MEMHMGTGEEMEKRNSQHSAWEAGCGRVEPRLGLGEDGQGLDWGLEEG